MPAEVGQGFFSALVFELQSWDSSTGKSTEPMIKTHGFSTLSCEINWLCDLRQELASWEFSFY